MKQITKYYRLFILALLLLLPSTGTAQISIDTVSAPRPHDHDNRNTYFPPVIAQVGESCGSASGIGYVFTYEINAARDVPGADSLNQYPYFATFNYLNDGNEMEGTHMMFLDAWNIVKENGIVNAVDFGSIEPRSRKWVSGYERHFRGMHNRIAAVDSLSFLDDGTFTAMKQWLFDHGNGSPAGGIFSITVSAYGVQADVIRVGPAAGKVIVRTFGPDTTAGRHNLAVVGYNDSIRYDFNRDGAVTDQVDIDKDGKQTILDNEFGAFICANTWGTTSGDDGFFYVPYRLFVLPGLNGGLLANTAWFINVRHEYRPIRTLRAVITHKHRNSIALSVGIAADTTVTEPKFIRPLQQYTFAGGDFPMSGEAGTSTIEIGLDVTDLIDSLQENRAASYFLIIDQVDGSGSCDDLALVDYSSGEAVEYVSPDAPGTISEGKNYYRMNVPPLRVRKNVKSAVHTKIGSIRLQHNRIRIRLTPAVCQAKVFRCDGTLCGRYPLPQGKGWLTLPLQLQPGLFIVQTTDLSGATAHAAIITVPSH